MGLPPIDVCLRSLLVNGYVLDSARSDRGFLELRMHRFDHFNVRVRYNFVFYEALSNAGAKACMKTAKFRSANLVLIGPQSFADVPCFTWEAFVAQLGGPVLTWDVIEPGFRDRLVEVGHNRLPTGLTGRPDTIFETMVKAALQFMLSNRVIQYGQERLFEKLPDGVAFIDSRTPILYDCKAYGKGFSVTADDVRRFSDYVKDFTRRYGNFFDPVHSFLVVTGKMADSERSISTQAVALRAACNVQLVVLEANELGLIVESLASNPVVRRALDWRLLLADKTLRERDVQAELQRVQQDRIIGR